MLPKRSFLSLLSLALGGGLVPLVHADVKTSFFTSNSHYAYELLHMPDLDQRRAFAPGIFGLPLNGGMYCVPASTMNMMIYAANHGFPEVWPGPGFYQSPSLYDAAGLNIFALGAKMGTDPATGTGGNGAFEGAKWWFDNSAPGKFTVSLDGAHGTYSPTLTTMTKAAMNGALIGFGYGRYDVTGSYDGHPLVQRVGGHAVTFSKSSRFYQLQTVWCRDPANPNDNMLLDQSTFGNRELSVRDVTFAAAASDGAVRLMSALNYDSSAASVAIIDGYMAIRPKAGYSFKDFKTIKLDVPLTLGGTPVEQVFSVDGVVLDATLDPDQIAFVVLVAGADGKPGSLQTIDLLDGSVSFVASLPGAKSLCFGRKHELYVATGTEMLALDLGDTKLVKKSLDLPFPVDAMAYDDARDELVALSIGAKRLIRFPEALGGEPKSHALPAGLPMGGHATVAIDPTSGAILFATDKSATLYRAIEGPQGFQVIETALPAVQKIDGFDVDDAGHLFVSSLGKTAEFEETALAGWQPVLGSPWNLTTSGRSFRITKSRTNFDPKTMSGPGWNQIDASLFDDVASGPFQPDCDGAAVDVEYGTGKAGSLGVPHLRAEGPAIPGAQTTLVIENVAPGAPVALFVGSQSAALPFDGGTLHVLPLLTLSLPATAGADGKLQLPLIVPADPKLCGVTVYHQAMLVDPASSGHYHTAQTNGLARTFGN